MNETEWLRCTYPEEMLHWLGAGAHRSKLRLFVCACCRRVENLLGPSSVVALALLEQHPEGADDEGARQQALREAGRDLAVLRRERESADEAWQQASRHWAEVGDATWVEDVVPEHLLQAAAAERATQAVLLERNAALEAARAAMAAAAAEDLSAIAVARLAMRARTSWRQAFSEHERAARYRSRAEGERERRVRPSRAHIRVAQVMDWLEHREDDAEENEPEMLRGWEREERAAQCALLRDIFGHLRYPGPLDPSWLRWRGGILVEMARSIHEERRFSDLPVLADALEDAGCADERLLAHCRSGGPHVFGCWLLELISTARAG
jgi:hypothetical protein